MTPLPKCLCSSPTPWNFSYFYLTPSRSVLCSSVSPAISLSITMTTPLFLVKTVLTSVRKCSGFYCERNKSQLSSVLPILSESSALLFLGSVPIYDRSHIHFVSLSFGSQGNLRLGDLLCLIRALRGKSWLHSLAPIILPTLRICPSPSFHF